MLAKEFIKRFGGGIGGVEVMRTWGIVGCIVIGEYSLIWRMLGWIGTVSVAISGWFVS